MGRDGSATPITLKANLGDTLTTLSGAFTGASLNSYTANLTIPPSVVPVVFTATAQTSAIYNVTQSANFADVQGSWTGNWVDGSNSSSGQVLQVGALGGSRVLSTPSTGVLYCFLDVESSLAANGRGNFFNVVLKFSDLPTPLNTSPCPRNGQTLRGVALVYRPTELLQKLRMIAFDDAGKGISFSAQR